MSKRDYIFYTTLILVTWICAVTGNSLDECQLYVGGNFVVAGENSISSSFLKYDLSANEFSTNYGSGVFLDSYMDNMFYLNGHLFLSGDIVRFNTSNSVSIGSFNFTTRQLDGAASGIWLKSKSSPNYDISPSLLFAKYRNQLVVAGHFQFLPSNVLREYNNIVIYNSATGSYSEFPQDGIILSGKSITGLEFDIENDAIYISTVLEASGVVSEIYQYLNETWTQLENPASQNSQELTILFNSLHKSGDSLFAIGYYSSSGSLTDSIVYFYLLSWDVTNLLLQPRVSLLWQKNCGDGNIYFPTLNKYLNSTILISIPNSNCPTTATDVQFKVYDAQLTQVTTTTISNLAKFRSCKFLQTTGNGDIFAANEMNVSFFKLSHNWETVMQNSGYSIKSLVFSDLSSELYIGYSQLTSKTEIAHVDYCPYTPSTSSSHLLRYNLFNADLYKNGKINTITELPNSAIMIGGDFKFVENGNSLLNTKLASIWNGTSWHASLSRNDDSYLPGWSLLSTASIGGSVYAIADARNTLINDTLPVLRWSSSDGWLYLYNRPTLYSNSSYDPTYGTVYIDPILGDVYFGGNFSVRYTTSPNHMNVTSGVIIYNIEKEMWRSLPVNLTSVHSIVPMDNNKQLLQIGGTFKFSITDHEGNLISCQNFAIYNISSNSFLPAIPASPASTVYTISLFPGQSKYSFVGGIFGQNGVEQLRYVSGVWSWSLFGNTQLPANVYSLASRNEGNILFAGGSFESMLAKFDIPSQQWSYLLSREDEVWKGQVNTVTLICNFDNLYENYQSEWGATSMLGSLYSQPDCDIPIGAGDDYVCPSTPLTNVQIFGICATVVITLVIVGAIGLFAFKAYKDHQKTVEVEYL